MSDAKKEEQIALLVPGELLFGEKAVYEFLEKRYPAGTVITDKLLASHVLNGEIEVRRVKTGISLSVTLKGTLNG